MTPPKLFKREFVRPKYRRKAEPARPPVVAPAPARPVAGGYASAGLMAWVVTAKYHDHQPLFRQEQQFARWGAEISRQTMVEWICQAAHWTELIYKRIRQKLLAGGYVQVDDGVRSAEKAKPEAQRRVSRAGARKAGGEANKRRSSTTTPRPKKATPSKATSGVCLLRAATSCSTGRRRAVTPAWPS